MFLLLQTFTLLNAASLPPLGIQQGEPLDVISNKRNALIFQS
jgi:hypothetical protein